MDLKWNREEVARLPATRSYEKNEAQTKTNRTVTAVKAKIPMQRQRKGRQGARGVRALRVTDTLVQDRQEECRQGVVETTKARGKLASEMQEQLFRAVDHFLLIVIEIARYSYWSLLLFNL